ncbi:uncharacterized protein Tco025E_00062 [Trypanosoma conorhini]|uniref:Uncharacterized protein n=1 Tax=Trypanosoma conorhini TaxID=83891 RepID=A0A422QCI2_9TRYP|nr:uncharacterized protein Tco025E_00062 [Trypanosoma conorhini]RNF27678.1 hypothetical protein Tco025E_00062 [Trypanosoma conorhini]
MLHTVELTMYENAYGAAADTPHGSGQPRYNSCSACTTSHAHGRGNPQVHPRSRSPSLHFAAHESFAPAPPSRAAFPQLFSAAPPPPVPPRPSRPWPHRNLGSTPGIGAAPCMPRAGVLTDAARGQCERRLLRTWDSPPQPSFRLPVTRHSGLPDYRPHSDYSTIPLTQQTCYCCHQ